MKTVQIFGKNDIRVTKLGSLPKIAEEDEVLVEIAFCGICGTDLHEYTSGPIFAPEPGNSHEFSGVELPLSMGHEYAGTVIDIGSKVSKLKIGDRVCVDVSYACLDQGIDPLCASCQSGNPNTCKRLCLRGLSASNGGLSELSVLPERALHKLPDNVPLDIGALVQPLSISWHAVRVSGFKSGSTALVLGCGPIGIATILALKGHGASKIIVSEPAEARRVQAIELGASVAINPFDFGGGERSENLVAEVVRHTGPLFEGVDYSFDCGGFQSTLDTALGSIKSQGTAVNVAVWADKPANFYPMNITNREKRYVGSMGLTGQDMDEVLDAFATGRVSIEDARTMITSKIHLEDTVELGFHQLLNHKDKHIKILIAPNGHIEGIPKGEAVQHLPHGVDILTWQRQFEEKNE